jgi:hypothetical protein
MYVMTVVLFLVPASLIVIAWRSANRYRHKSQVRDWRDHLMIGALILGSCAIPMGLVGNLAWLHLGGNPHGLGTPQGMWIPLRRVFFSAIAISACMAIFGKGGGRVLTLVALAVAFVSDTMVVLLQME